MSTQWEEYEGNEMDFEADEDLKWHRQEAAKQMLFQMIADETGEVDPPQDAKPRKVLTGFHGSSTGVFGTYYYDDNHLEVFGVSSLVTPFSHARIKMGERTWYSDFDPETTLFPGIFRQILKFGTKEQEARIVHRGPGQSQIITQEDAFYVREVPDGYEFYAPAVGSGRMTVIARITRIKTADWLPEKLGFEMDPSFRVELYQPAGVSFTMRVLSYPELNIS